jgi:hypothetical protein
MRFLQPTRLYAVGVNRLSTKEHLEMLTGYGKLENRAGDLESACSRWRAEFGVI